MRPVSITNPDHFVNVARRRAAQEPNSIFADQFENLANFRAHLQTGQELWQQCRQQLDGFVCGAGTGGTIAGISTFLKQQQRNVQVFLIDPPGSSLYNKVPCPCLALPCLALPCLALPCLASRSPLACRHEYCCSCSTRQLQRFAIWEGQWCPPNERTLLVRPIACTLAQICNHSHLSSHKPCCSWCGNSTAVSVACLLFTLQSSVLLK